MAVSRLRTLFISTFVIFCCLKTSNTEINIPLNKDGLKGWTEKLSKDLVNMFVSATGQDDLQNLYNINKSTKLENVMGQTLLSHMTLEMEKMLQNKVSAIRRLVEAAEDAYVNHTYDKKLSIEYPNAKKLNLSEFLVEEDEHFNYISVNTTLSTVHVPTNVYDQSSEVVNGVNWSEALDPIFVSNYQNDPTLTWQYFGSATGFFRNYPGNQWQMPENNVDLFDCRTRGWYIQAATTPKDIVILLDTSGSMKGLRMEIAKATVDKILDTLSDDDFFNVIPFAEEPIYVDSCFNKTLIQANADNKKRIKDHVSNVSTNSIAKFDKALVEAFELFQLMNETGRGALCNKAIMIITDGPPETFEEIFSKYNWPEKTVRVFTYLIGQEVGETKQVRWMACSNKGYYSHISTLADVQEHVQMYVRVVSRPMVIEKANNTIWTPVYMSANSLDNTEKGLNMMTSVAQPVYDMKNDTYNEGILLGVMGTDVPLKELTKLTPQYKLGVNGYAFAITNNGYILFHPDFRPTKGNIIKPNYNSVDLAEVELEASDSSSSTEANIPNYELELRKNMIDRKTGSLTINRVLVAYDDLKRVDIRNHSYFYNPIKDTPFSLGIALPEDYGFYRVVGKLSINSVDSSVPTLQNDVHIKVAPWNYCKMETNETKQNQVKMLIRYINYGQNGNALYSQRCDDELIQHLLYDANMTNAVFTDWFNNKAQSAKQGVELVFLGTKGGLTRFLPIVDNLTDATFIEDHTKTIEELYYKRAADFGRGRYIFSIPFDAGAKIAKNETTDPVVVTISTPIVVKESEVTKPTGSAVAAVMGLQLKYSKLYEYMMNSSTCSNGTCSHTCASNELNCYLIDNNGFIVVSETESEVGKFFGEVDGTLMKKLLAEKVFKKVKMYDYQGLCEVYQRERCSASSLLNPFKRLFSGISWMISEIALFLVNFNLASWWNTAHTFVTADTSTAKTYSMCDQDFELFMDEKISNMYDVTDDNVMNVNVSGVVTNYTVCNNCTKSFAIQRVPKTNLMMLVIDTSCYCISDHPITIVPKEVEYNDTMTCSRLKMQVYRKRPEPCYPTHEVEDSQKCRSSLFVPSIILTVFTLLFGQYVL